MKCRRPNPWEQGQPGSSCRLLGFQRFAMVSDGGCFQPLLANLTIKVVMPVMVYKWVIEKGLGAGYVFPGRGLVFSKVFSTILLHQRFVQVSWWPPWHPHVRMPCGSSTMVYPCHPKGFRDILWPEAVLRAWASPAPHPSVRAPGTFLASTTEVGRLTPPAVQINIINFDFVFWTTHINCVARLLLAITCLLFPCEVMHAST